MTRRPLAGSNQAENSAAVVRGIVRRSCYAERILLRPGGEFGPRPRLLLELSERLFWDAVADR